MIKTNNKVEKVFKIEIVETLSNLVEISAENEQEALLKAQDMYRSEEIVLYPDDCIDINFNIVKRK
ncbi:DpnD/PcfM family protein [Psychrobacter sp. APC 3426]|uniref:DpnD/PcfM family protein n=1 Tax=Psychrobacter sp. APC 3426 TaxID=3035177 RepID=UPI0025B59C2A|nr:DpnD/PcfM family protein [Psychrobacter sp. APC 3426]MDN3399061.1 DpnD/PcfM family protein [Psychrobacter sp. APC 3426]